jgi:hypothetical protein
MPVIKKPDRTKKISTPDHPIPATPLTRRKRIGPSGRWGRRCVNRTRSMAIPLSPSRAGMCVFKHYPYLLPSLQVKRRRKGEKMEQFTE